MTVKFGVRVKGLDEVSKELRARQSRQRQAFRQAINVEGEILRRESLELVPRQTGDLADTATVVKATSAKNPIVEVRYGGEVKIGAGGSGREGGGGATNTGGRRQEGDDVDYAERVHEAPPSTNFRVGQRKFLQVPFERRASDFASNITRRIRKILGI